MATKTPKHILLAYAALLGFTLAVLCTGCTGLQPTPTVCGKATYYVGNGTYANSYSIQYASDWPASAVAPMYYCTGTVQ